MQKESIIFDQYQRYETIARIIKYFQNQQQNKKIKVLELGSNSHKDLRLFIPDADITFTDIVLTEEMQQDADFKQEDGTNLTFPDNSFDFVVAADVLEHVDKEKREMFLLEAYRVATEGVVLCFPYASENVENAEKRVNSYYKAICGKDFIWLQEHQRCGLPNLQDIEDVLGNHDIKYEKFFHGDLSLWEKMWYCHLSTVFAPETQAYCEGIDHYYNSKLYLGDISNECYRTFFVLSHSNTKMLNEYIQEMWKQTKESDIKFLDTLLQARKDVYPQRERAELERKVYEQNMQIAAVEAKLSDASQKNGEYENKLSVIAQERAGYEAKLAVAMQENAEHSEKMSIILRENIAYTEKIILLQKDLDELQNINLDLKDELQKVLSECDAQTKNAEQSREQYHEIVNRYHALQVQKQQFQNMYDTISNAFFWKITKPFRSMTDWLKFTFRNCKPLKLAWKGLKCYKQNGFSYTCRKVKTVLCQGDHREVITVGSCDNTYIKFFESGSVQKIDAKIAVHLHLYYVDLLDEFVRYLNNIPFNFDVFVSVKQGEDLEPIRAQLRQMRCVNKIVVEETINRGRDIAPLYVQFAREIERYDYFLHIHSKKSLFTGREQYGWRQYSMDCLVGDEDLIRRIFYQFENNNVGLFFPELTRDLSPIACHWLANVSMGKKLLQSMNIEFEDGFFNYPVGSFFWAKTDAVRPIFDLHLKYEDFPEENGQTDGTIAHALERVIAPVAKSRGYKLAIYDCTDRELQIGKSLKPFRSYFSSQVPDVQKQLEQYELVSFDIFDTLITRCVFQPDDVFLLMERKIKEKYNIELDFLPLRKKAEQLAWEKRRSYCSIHDIYQEIPRVCKISTSLAEEWKLLEIDLELQLCIPRKDMLSIFNYLKGEHKKIILVSDMYLTSEIINKMLEKCGYFGWDDLWISCEKGARKDDGTMWNDFFAHYGEFHTVHVGDNPRSDLQLVGDTGKDVQLIMNPVFGFQLSGFYAQIHPFSHNRTVEESIFLGLLINKILFNSPFAQDVNGNPRINDLNKIGYSVFGPLFSNFIYWVGKNSTQGKQKLLFLAREGYLFMKIYRIYCKMFKKDDTNAAYFLTSRRAVSVAAVRSEKDLEDIIKQYYQGTYSNLLKVRLGMELFDDLQEKEIKLPEDFEYVMSGLKPHLGDILDHAQQERQEYLNYCDEMDTMNQEVAVVDIGYSGTIQYFLAKLLDKKINGYYLAMTEDKKPEKIGCECFSIYPQKSSIFASQLFFEAVLKAPFGQLLCFQNNEPVFGEDSVCSLEVEKLQEGILAFAEDYFQLVALLGDVQPLNKDLLETMFNELLSLGVNCVESNKVFCVQDDYCSNGKLYFDSHRRSWKV